MPKTTSGDTFLEGTIVIGGNLTVEATLTANQLNVTTMNILNLSATNLVATTGTINHAIVQTADITTSNENVSNIATANIGNANIQVAGIITSNTSTANIGTGNVSNLNVSNSQFTFNSLPFYYGSGSWTPILTYLLSDANGNHNDFVNYHGSYAVYQHGWYERMGGEVTIYWDI
ncbi:MAG TPA: hypothetical protein VIJ25_00855, partial [Methylococcales bacterium]